MGRFIDRGDGEAEGAGGAGGAEGAGGAGEAGEAGGDGGGLSHIRVTTNNL